MNLSEIQPKEIMPGYHGKLVHGERMSWVFWDVDQDAEVPEHQHEHEQITPKQAAEYAGSNPN